MLSITATPISHGYHPHRRRPKAGATGIDLVGVFDQPCPSGPGSTRQLGVGLLGHPIDEDRLGLSADRGRVTTWTMGEIRRHRGETTRQTGSTDVALPFRECPGYSKPWRSRR